MKRIAKWLIGCLFIVTQAFSATTITDNGTYLIVDNGFRKELINKPFECVIESTVKLRLQDHYAQVSFLTFADVTLPAHTTIDNLQSVLMAFNTTGVAPLPSGAATSALQTAGNASLTTIAAKDFATQTTSAAILAKIIAAPSTEAKQDVGNSSLSTIAGKDFATQTTLALIKAKTDNIPAVGQTTMSGSTPVAIASNQTAIPVSGSVSVSNFPATQPVSAAALPLPTGASTSALQTTGNTSLSSILAKIIAAPATEAKQDAGNAFLSTITADLDVVNAFLSNIAQDVHTNRTGTLSLVGTSDSDVEILAEQDDRKGWMLFNNSTQPLYLLLAGGTSDINTFSVIVQAQGYYECPFRYRGVVHGFWTANDGGTAMITSFVP